MGRRRKQPDNVIQLDFMGLVDHVVVGKPKPFWVPQYVVAKDGSIHSDFAEIISSRVVRREPRPFDKPIRWRRDPLTFTPPKFTAYCSCCGEWVDRLGFAENKSNRNGLQNWCKECSNRHARKMYYLMRAG